MVRLHLPVTVETQHLLLQRLRYEDAEEIFYSYASKSEATRFVSFPTHQSVQDSRSFLRYAIPAWDKGEELIYGIRLRQTNLLIGSIGFTNENGKVQFGYILSPNYWGKGLMTEACTTTLDIVKQHPGVYRIWTLVDVDNIASTKVLQKCGLAEEAWLPKWMRFFNQDNQPKDCKLYRLSYVRTYRMVSFVNDGN